MRIVDVASLLNGEAQKICLRSALPAALPPSARARERGVGVVARLAAASPCLGTCALARRRIGVRTVARRAELRCNPQTLNTTQD